MSETQPAADRLRPRFSLLTVLLLADCRPTVGASIIAEYQRQNSAHKIKRHSLLPGRVRMGPNDLQKLLQECPLLIRMNDGREYFVDKPEFIVVGDYTAGILIDDEGIKRNAVITLMNIASILPHATVQKK